MQAATAVRRGCRIVAVSTDAAAGADYLTDHDADALDAGMDVAIRAGEPYIRVSTMAAAIVQALVHAASSFDAISIAQPVARSSAPAAACARCFFALEVPTVQTAPATSAGWHPARLVMAPIQMKGRAGSNVQTRTLLRNSHQTPPSEAEPADACANTVAGAASAGQEPARSALAYCPQWLRSACVKGSLCAAQLELGMQVLLGGMPPRFPGRLATVARILQ